MGDKQEGTFVVAIDIRMALRTARLDILLTGGRATAYFFRSDGGNCSSPTTTTTGSRLQPRQYEAATAGSTALHGVPSAAVRGCASRLRMTTSCRSRTTLTRQELTLTERGFAHAYYDSLVAGRAGVLRLDGRARRFIPTERRETFDDGRRTRGRNAPSMDPASEGFVLRHEERAGSLTRPLHEPRQAPQANVARRPTSRSPGEFLGAGAGSRGPWSGGRMRSPFRMLSPSF